MNGSHFDTSSLASLPNGGSGKQYLYAIGLDGGLTKFGRTSNPRQRLGVHLRHAGGLIVWHCVTPALRDGPSYEAERRMLRLASEGGERIGRQEVFAGIRRHAAIRMVSMAMRPAVLRIRDDKTDPAFGKVQALAIFLGVTR